MNINCVVLTANKACTHWELVPTSTLLSWPPHSCSRHWHTCTLHGLRSIYTTGSSEEQKRLCQVKKSLLHPLFMVEVCNLVLTATVPERPIVIGQVMNTHPNWRTACSTGTIRHKQSLSYIDITIIFYSSALSNKYKEHYSPLQLPITVYSDGSEQLRVLLSRLLHGVQLNYMKFTWAMQHSCAPSISQQITHTTQ